MNRKIYIISLLLCTAIVFGGISYAGNGGGGMGGGSGNGGMGGGMGAGMGGSMGGGHGMMGGQGHGMMNYGPNQNYSNPRATQPRTDPNYQYEKKETEILREEIKAKRQELSALYRSEQPNKEMIDQKIVELNDLEARLDETLR